MPGDRSVNVQGYEPEPESLPPHRELSDAEKKLYRLRAEAEEEKQQKVEDSGGAARESREREK